MLGNVVKMESMKKEYCESKSENDKEYLKKNKIGLSTY